MRDIEFSVLEAQQDIHEMIAQQKPLEQTLEAIANWVGKMMPGALVSIMRFYPDTNSLSPMPNSRFSDNFSRAMQNIPVAEGIGTCGTAALTKCMVITEDIQKDPRWDGYRDIAETEGLTACWSMPILTSEKELLGTFCHFYRAPAIPTSEARRNLIQSAALAALAILRHRDTEDLLILSERHQALFDNHPYGVFTFGLDGHFLSCNAAMERLMGHTADHVQGLHFNLFVEPGYRAQTQAAFDRARNGETITYETIGTHASGHPYFLEVTNFPVTIKEHIVGVYGICRDITDRKEQEAQITFQATHDLLTGLPNEASFKEKLRDALAADGERGSLVAMYLGLDGFKPINRELGHLVGDQILMTIAQRLKGLVGPEVIVARLDGDEFCLLIPNYTHQQEIIQLVERVLADLAQPIDVDGQMVHISASIGIARNSMHLDAPHELLQFAGLALEQAKRQGRNTSQWYSSHKTEHSRNSVSLRHDLHAALMENQFEIHYQPLVDAVTGRIRSVEALVRWHHPIRGMMISPGEFIPLAEQTGQIIPMGLWILRRACTEMADFNAHRERPLPVAVNISSLQFVRDGFLDDVRRVLEETGISPQMLELEVTESVLLDGTAPVIELMETLKTLGVRLVLDDFGTGYSSLSYLRDLPVHKVKLDRSFVEKTATDHRIAAIVQGVITMAHHMDMTVVAEGVETWEQQEDLARRHCDILQGYLFAQPMPVAELKKLPDLLPVDSAI